MGKARERAKATKAKYQQGRIAIMFDGVSVPEQPDAIAIWQKVQDDVLCKIGKTGCVFEADGFLYKVAAKGKWEKVHPQYAKRSDILVIVSRDSIANLKLPRGSKSEYITRIKAGEGVIPPVGWIHAIVRNEEDGTEGTYWVAPSAFENSKPCSILTQEQIENITAIQESLSDVDNQTLDRWLYNMSCNQHPDWEIGILAKIAVIIEIERQHERTPSELKDIYHALMALSCMPIDNNLQNLLSSFPKAKAIKNLERVVSLWTHPIEFTAD